MKRVIGSIRAARNRGVHHLYLSCLAANAKMQAIARKHDADLRFELGEVVGEIVPREPNYFSLFEEAVEDRSCSLHDDFAHSMSAGNFPEEIDSGDGMALIPTLGPGNDKLKVDWGDEDMAGPGPSRCSISELAAAAATEPPALRSLLCARSRLCTFIWPPSACAVRKVRLQKLQEYERGGQCAPLIEESSSNARSSQESLASPVAMALKRLLHVLPPPHDRGGAPQLGRDDHPC